MPAFNIGPVILDIIGTELTQEEQEILQHPSVGGVILFTRNYQSPQQLQQLCQDIRHSRKLPLLITADQEGGRVQRFREGFTRIPSMGQIGRMYHVSPEQALAFSAACGWIMASELLACGIDLSFAPVIDLNKEISPVVGDRSFHKNPDDVIKLARSLISGMRLAGMSSTGKHFPGHGSVNVDSHFKLPEDMRDIDEISREDLQTFLQLIPTELSAIMAAHIIFPKLDDKPVGFSKYWLKKILREQYQFPGMIFSDDLNMNGASVIGDYPNRALVALEAGCDMILICNNRLASVQILDALPQQYFVNTDRFKMMQGKFSLSYDQLKTSREWKDKYTFIMRSTENFLEKM